MTTEVRTTISEDHQQVVFSISVIVPHDAGSKLSDVEDAIDDLDTRLRTINVQLATMFGGELPPYVTHVTTRNEQRITTIGERGESPF